MKLVIITGTSKGLGFELAKFFCKKSYTVISISKSQQKFDNCGLIRHLIFDLSNPGEFEALESQIFSMINIEKVKSALLINNAAIIGIPNRIKKYSYKKMTKVFKVDLVAPILLSTFFLNLFGDKNISTTIINISSGAAYKPISGLAAYSAAKAGLESFTKSLAIENKKNKKFKVLSISPGVMDSDMQKEIRESTKEEIPEVDLFTKLKTKNLLCPTIKRAGEIISIYESNHFLSGDVLFLDK